MMYTVLIFTIMSLYTDLYYRIMKGIFVYIYIYIYIFIIYIFTQL